MWDSIRDSIRDSIGDSIRDSIGDSIGDSILVTGISRYSALIHSIPQIHTHTHY